MTTLDALLRLRLRSDEKTYWEQAAQERGMSISALVRNTVGMSLGSYLATDNSEHSIKIPDPLWGQLQETAQTNNCSINSLVLNTLGSTMSAGATVSWTQTVSYAPLAGSSFAGQSNTISTRESLLAEGRRLLELEVTQEIIDRTAWLEEGETE